MEKAIAGHSTSCETCDFPSSYRQPLEDMQRSDMHGIAAGILSNKPVTLITTAAPTPPSQESLETQTLSTHNESPVCAAVEFSCAMAASSLLEIADNVATITLCREKEKTFGQRRIKQTT